MLKLRVLTFQLFCVGILVYLSGCSSQASATMDDSAESTGKLLADTAFSVTTELIQPSVFYQTITARGTLRSVRFTNLSFPQAGRIVQLAVPNTARVKKGQLIARLENDRMVISLEEARIALANTWSLYENELAAFGDSTHYEANWERIKEKIALKSGLQAAQIAEKRAAFELSQTYIYAPFDGVLEGLVLREGDVAAAFATIATLLDPSSFEVVIDVLEFDMGYLAKGHSMEVSPLAFPNLIVKGYVTEINPRVDSRGYIRVIGQLQSQPYLYDGMSVSVLLKVPIGERISVPKEAVVIKSGRNVVFTLEQQLAKWNYVEIAEDNGHRLVISEGLPAGKEVIISGNLQLAHDSPVIRE